MRPERAAVTAFYVALVAWNIDNGRWGWAVFDCVFITYLLWDPFGNRD